MGQAIAQRITFALLAGAAVALIFFFCATSFVASVFNAQAALGAPLFSWDGSPIFAPWSILAWCHRWAGLYPRPFAVADFILAAGLLSALFCFALIVRGKRNTPAFGKYAWAGFSDIKAAGLFSAHGTVLGKFEGETLVYDGVGHQLLVGASRSGKGRGHVVPSLLAWPHSALVLDVKGELADGDARVAFPGTAGFRERLGPVLRFAPTREDSVSFNPLFEVRKGANEVRDAKPSARRSRARHRRRDP